MMDKKGLQRILLTLLIFSRRAQLVLVTKHKMNWYDALNYCKLATEEQAINHIEHYRAYVGGLSLTTRWMVHEGCFEQTSTKDKERIVFQDNSPSRCSYYCRKYTYFALMDNMCRCANEVRSSNRTHMEICSKKCPGENRDMCGSKTLKYINRFRHILGQYTPKGHLGEEYMCSALVVVDNLFHVKTAKCNDKIKVICGTRETGISFYPTLKSAGKFCHLWSDLEENIVSKYNISSGVYKIGIHRRKVIRWIEHESFSQICDEVGSQQNIKCILFDRKSRKNMMRVPVDCNEWHPVLCSYWKTPSNRDTRTFETCAKDVSTINIPEMTSISYGTFEKTVTKMDKFSPTIKTETTSVDNLDLYHTVLNSLTEKITLRQQVVLSSEKQPPLDPLTLDVTCPSTSDDLHTQTYGVSILTSRPTTDSESPNWFILTGVFVFCIAVGIPISVFTYRNKKVGKAMTDGYKTNTTDRKVKHSATKDGLELAESNAVLINLPVYDRCGEKDQYHHLNFTMDQGKGKFSQSVGYDQTSVKAFSQKSNIGQQLNWKPSCANPSVCNVNSKIIGEYCQTEICHLNLLYDIPSIDDKG